METRKVQLSGGTTYTVSLPKSWAQEHGIDAGSTLSLYPNSDGSLLVEPEIDRSTETWSTTVDISTDADSTIRRRIQALHVVGFDSVTLVDKTGHSTERRALIEDTVADLSGFELLEAGETRIQLTNLIDAENVDVRKSALRLRLVMLGMHRDAVNAVLNDDETLAQRVIDRDSEADKLFAMITRHFRRALTNLYEVEKLAYNRDELFEYYYVSRQFERIADHAEKIAQFTLDPEISIPSPFDEHIDRLSSSSRQVVDTAADVILADAGIEGAYTALTKRDELTAGLTELDRELYTHDDPAEAYVVGLLLDSIRRTAEYGGNIASIGIQQVARDCECLK
ncbi:MAG: PhoU domain-containing protein [Halorhabdus sp.]